VKAYLHALPHRQHQVDAMTALWEGLTRHNITVASEPEDADFTVWWNDLAPPSVLNRPRLFLEAGYINGSSGDYVPDRLRFISAGWNAMHNDAKVLPDAPDDRWNALGIEMKPWRVAEPVDSALLLGQVNGDRSAPGPDTWDTIIVRASERWNNVRVRKHPLVGKEPRLSEQLAEFDVAVTWASTAAVECVVEGVPTVTLFRNAIAWPVTAHDLSGDIKIPDREQWAYNLAYRQWTHAELSDGSAWEWLKQGLE
jgi:hypothetical protein